MRPTTTGGRREMEQLELGLEFGTPDPLPSVTYFDPIFGATQAPANLYGE